MNTRFFSIAASVAVFLAPVHSSRAQEKESKVDVSQATKDKDGFFVHEVESPYQKGKTQIFVLTPDMMDDGKKYPVVYVLPVEPGHGTRWGDALLEIKKLDLHNKLGIIFVMPTFSDWPWYCDHPTNPVLRQETYFLKVVVAFIEKTYPVSPGQPGRLLLGFSKSGWGPFHIAAAASRLLWPGRGMRMRFPLNVAMPNQFGMGPIFGTPVNFEKYQISSLLTSHAAKLKTSSRLAIIGYDRFRPHHQAIHEQMVRLDIPHEYRDVRQGKHDWRSGWLEDAVKFLVSK